MIAVKVTIDRIALPQNCIVKTKAQALLAVSVGRTAKQEANALSKYSTRPLLSAPLLSSDLLMKR